MQIQRVVPVICANETAGAKKPCQTKTAPYNAPSSTDEMSGSVESKAKNA